jgi:CheY-like chemotaxis protein
VRFSAALAIAGSLPDRNFPECQQVVLSLVQALRQRGELYALLVETQQDRRTLHAAELRQQGAFAQVLAGDNFAAVAQLVQTVPSIDLIVLADDIANPNLQRSLEMIRSDYQLAFVPTIVLAAQGRETIAQQLEKQHHFVSVLVQGASVTDIIQAAKRTLDNNQNFAFDVQLANQYAIDAAKTFQRLAVSGNQVLDLIPAQQTLIDALDEQREEIQTAAAETLARLDSTPAQRALAVMALDTQRPLPKRLFALDLLALSAKLHGNLLLGGQVQALYDLVQDTNAPAELRNMAAEAYGSLNLPSEKISQLILDQAQ